MVTTRAPRPSTTPAPPGPGPEPRSGATGGLAAGLFVLAAGLVVPALARRLHVNPAAATA